jgi:hypothetical protein
MVSELGLELLPRSRWSVVAAAAARPCRLLANCAPTRSHAAPPPAPASAPARCAPSASQPHAGCQPLPLPRARGVRLWSSDPRAAFSLLRCFLHGRLPWRWPSEGAPASHPLCALLPEGWIWERRADSGVQGTTSSAAALLGPHPGEVAVSDAREESSV